MSAVTRVLVAGDGNWNTAASWSPAAVPLATDHVLLGPDSPAMTTGPTGTNQDVKLGELITHPEYKYAVCSSGNPLIISASKVLIQHAGDFFFQCDAGGAANKTNRVTISTPSKNLGQKIEIGKSADPGDVDFVELLRGNATLTNATGIDEVHVGYVDSPSGDAELTINSGTATIPILRAMAGRVHCSTTVTSLFADGAFYRQLLNTITSLYGSAGVVEFNSAATLALARLFGTCELDLTKDVQVKIITELNTYGQSKIRKFAGSVLHTITAHNEYRKVA